MSGYDFEEDIVVKSIDNQMFRCHKLDDSNFAKGTGEMLEVEEEEETMYEIQHDAKDGKFFVKMEIDPSLYGVIIGKKGKMLHSIQGKTGAVIQVPGKRDKSSEVVVKSASRKSVVSAANQIEILLAESYEKSPYTHFLSLPLVTPEVIENVGKFCEKLNDDSVIPRAQKRGFDPTICIKPQHFHMTLFMLKLIRKQDIHRMILLLKENAAQINEKVLGNGYMEIDLSEWEIMNDDPSDTHGKVAFALVLFLTFLKVLFAKIGVKDDRLKKLIDFLGDLLLREGFIKESDLDVKLHATVLNSRYRGGGGGEKTSDGKRISFDATEILKLKCDLGGNVKIETLELSKRGSYDKRGYYSSEHSLQLV